MNTYIILCALLNFITSTICGLFVLLNNKKSKINQTFSLYTLLVAIWAIFEFLWLTTKSELASLEYARVGLIFTTFIPVTFLHFSVYLVDRHKDNSLFIKIMYTVSILISLTGFSNFFIKKVEFLLPVSYWPIAGPSFTLFLIEYIFVVAYALFIIRRKYLQSQHSERLRLKYVFYGILLAYIGGASNFPLCYKIPFWPIGNIMIPFYTIFITYAIFRYQLMDIKVVIKKSLVYTLLITIITIFYLVAIYIAEHIIQTVFGYKSLFVSLTSAIFIALVFIPLKNFIQNLIEKNLFRGSYIQIAEQNELLHQEIIRSERSRTVAILASGMAHEIKNPLTPLKTFGEQLPQRLNDKEFLLKFSKIINKEVDRIDSLVQDLLNYAKPSPPKTQLANIHDLIEQTLALLNNDLIKHQINLNTSFENKNILINLDPKQIKQALLNIFLNAIDAMSQGGTLSVDTLLHNKGLQVKIHDTGQGINDHDLRHIFDPFFSKKDHGTGLGLSITHEIIKNHQGKILVGSTPGLGTTFTIELPI